MAHLLKVEVLQKPNSYFSKEAIAILAERFLYSIRDVIPGKTYFIKDFEDATEFESELKSHVKMVTICDIMKIDDTFVDISSYNIKFYVYRINFRGCESKIEEDEKDSLLEEGKSPYAYQWNLPSKDLFGLWESLVYDISIKRELLNFAETILLYSDINVDSNLVSLNRVVLLHGPPGTGKTSLCKALAQKLSIRLGGRYRRTRLIEINSNSLFSKWFSESGKQVMKLFENLRSMASDPEMLICVLIDEVESLAHSRNASFSGTEPSDSLRVVNCILTQLDLMKQYSNVFILTTSNLTGAIDLAFVDRADIKQYIGPPSVKEVYQIYLTCIQELVRKKVISLNEELLAYKMLDSHQYLEDQATCLSLELLELAKYSVGLNGRALRKIPLIAHSLYIESYPVKIQDFFAAMNRAIARVKYDNEIFT